MRAKQTISGGWLRLCVAIGGGVVAMSVQAQTPAVQASGVFINMQGDVLTARHAVTACPRLFVVKNGQVAPARVLAVSEQDDIAVVSTPLKPLLAATFSDADAPPANSIAVFSEAYAELQRLPDRARLLSNALTVPSEAGGLQMVSGAKPGTSGSAVLDGGGLLLGVVVERVAAGSGGGGSELSAMHRAARPGMGTLVKAVPSQNIRQFLAPLRIPFAQSSLAQIGSLQSPASRASTLAVGIICG